MHPLSAAVIKRVKILWIIGAIFGSIALVLPLGSSTGWLKSDKYFFGIIMNDEIIFFPEAFFTRGILIILSIIFGLIGALKFNRNLIYLSIVLLVIAIILINFSFFMFKAGFKSLFVSLLFYLIGVFILYNEEKCIERSID